MRVAQAVLLGCAAALAPQRAPRVLVVDCHDSYTVNVAQWLAEASAERWGGDVAAHWPTVVPHDDAAVAAALDADSAAFFGDYDALVLGPGPGHPADADAFAETAAGRCLRLAPEALPVLGVCLGHQGLALHYGRRVERLGEPRHGVASPVSHDGGGLFAGLPQNFRATRYHSLTVAETNGASDLKVTARDGDGAILALEHASLPRYGVQFHPESVATPRGPQIAANFLDIVARLGGARPSRPSTAAPPPSARAPPPPPYAVFATRVPFDGSPADVYARLFAGSGDAFWLDGPDADVLGDGGGPLGFSLKHATSRRGVGTTTVRRGGVETAEAGPLLPRLREILRRHRTAPRFLDRTTGAVLGDAPFGFSPGLVGYLGYEMRRETADYSPDLDSDAPPAPEPDAAFLFCGRAVALAGGEAWILELGPAGGGGGGLDGGGAWRDAALAALAAPPRPRRRTERRAISAAPRDARAAYAEKMAAARESILAGDSYEICLTTTFGADLDENVDVPDLYASLRAANPAPHAFLFDFSRTADAALLSSSPERFLRVDAGGRIEAKPIKGTAERSADPAEDARRAAALAASTKTFAENLMIADLIRNDLARSCVPGSVRAPELAALESFATVHQLVTTVAGDLAPGEDALSAVEKAFPPGSMTGAPKRRTCELLSSLEQCWNQSLV